MKTHVRNNLLWVNQKNSNGLLDKETGLFRNIGNQVNLLIEKSFLASSTYSESPSNFLTSPSLRIFFMWPIMILPPNPIQKKLFTLLKHSKQDSASVAPLHKHNTVHQDDPTKATILNKQF